MMILEVLIAGIIVYLLFNLIHHKHSKSLTFTILLEYLLTAVLVLILVSGVIFS